MHTPKKIVKVNKICSKIIDHQKKYIQEEILRCIELMSSCERPCVQDGTSSRLLIELSLANSLTPGTRQGKNPIDLHMSIEKKTNFFHERKKELKLTFFGPCLRRTRIEFLHANQIVIYLCNEVENPLNHVKLQFFFSQSKRMNVHCNGDNLAYLL